MINVSKSAVVSGMFPSRAENERKYSNVINIDCKCIYMELKYY